MATEFNRQQAARAAYDFYVKAAQTGQPMGPDSPLCSFYDDTSGIYHYYVPGTHHVIFQKLANPDYSTRTFPLPDGSRTLPVTMGNLAIDILPPWVAFQRLRTAVTDPRWGYTAIFDMSSPSWSIPVGEWPVGEWPVGEQASTPQG